ncbi:MAG: amino acid adenylation domain-containing protein [Spirochaetales bacterium]|nr:amino acid adenylation domain-containing protein [Spirochaetales bacterium]
MSDLIDRFKNLPQGKKAQFIQNLLEKKNVLSTKGTIPVKEPGTPNVVTLAQEGLFFEWQADPDSPRYNGTGIIDISGPLDVSALEKSIQKVIERHEVLRSRYVLHEGTVLQDVQDDPYNPFRSHDLCDKTGEQKKRLFDELLEKEHLAPFDLEKGRLLRCLLIVKSQTEFSLVITMHHIIGDEQALDIFIRDLVAYYEEIVTGKKADHPECPIRFSDFSTWQRKQWTDEKIRENIVFWDEALTGDVSEVILPADTQKSVNPFAGEITGFSISPQIKSRLHEIAGGENTTVFTLLLAAYYIVLYLFSRQEDLIVTSPFSDRRWSETESLMGYMLTILLLRVRLRQDYTFRDFLGMVKNTVLEVLSHRDISPQKLSGILRKRMDFHKLIANNIAFNYIESADRKAYSINNLHISPARLYFKTAVSRLSFMLINGENGMEGLVRYTTEMYAPVFIETLITSYLAVLEIITTDISLTLKDISLALLKNSNRAVIEANNTARQWGDFKSMPDTLREQASRVPDNMALEFSGTGITYKELNEKVNGLCHRLSDLGVSKGDPVGIFLDRSFELCIAVLAVLRIGGVYFPLETSLPKKRLSFMINDVNPKIILTSGSLYSKLPEENTDTFACVENELKANPCGDDPGVSISPDNVAYIIYTSGSTGNPKGILVTHQNLFNYFNWLNTNFPLDGEASIILKTPLSFDVSIRELFWAFYSGARLVILPPGEHTDPFALADCIKSRNVRVCNFVPSMLKVFVDEGCLKACRNLQTILSGGEELVRELRDRILSEYGVKLYNFYGPAEATITSTYHMCKANEAGPVPIGKPLANVGIYILDKHFRQVPIGVNGEIYVSGAGLSRGYLNRPGLNEERFLNLTMEGQGEIRAYRTGDRGRYLPDGSIVYLGRMDSQIKVRGVRVELGEIESFLNSHESIEQAVVLHKKNTGGDNRLIAYFVPSKKNGGNTEKIVADARDFLPDYMVPSAWVPMTAFPLNDNGKIDRNALPEPKQQRQTAETGQTEPLTRIQDEIINIWKEVLKVDRVRLSDNFFDLGGHSLLLYRVRRSIEQKLQVEIGILELFEYPSVKTLAQYLAGKDDKEASLVLATEREVKGNRREMALKRKRHMQNKLGDA